MKRKSTRRRNSPLDCIHNKVENDNDREKGGGTQKEERRGGEDDEKISRLSYAHQTWLNHGQLITNKQTRLFLDRNSRVTDQNHPCSGEKSLTFCEKCVW